MIPRPPVVLLVVVLLTAVGCGAPADGFARRARALGLETQTVRGAAFDHVVFRRPGPRSPSLHVYLDGDGTPWFGGLPARDPTPRTPLVLSLMARDPDASLYLGRPCYHGLAGASGCTDTLWTSERYSEAVVASLAAAVRRIAEAEGVRHVTWFGYSGGGSLAMLLAPRVPETLAVVTVAANLDVAAWIRHHDVRPLDGSLDPAREPPLPPRIVQRHWVGAADPEVPPAIVRLVAGTALVVVPGFDHVCCWQEIWPDVLADVRRAEHR
ncbi:MAG: alpha/beta fold hydrolase [Candidatus Rokuibacteriota bacterium]